MSNAQRRRAAKTDRASLDMAAQMQNASLRRKLADIQAKHGTVSEEEAKLVADITVEALEAVYSGKGGAEAFADAFIRVFQMGYKRGGESAFLQAVAVFQSQLAEAGYEMDIEELPPGAQA